MAQLCEQTLEISILIKRKLIRATCFANVTYEVCSIIIVSINLVIAKEKSYTSRNMMKAIDIGTICNYQK